MVADGTEPVTLRRGYGSDLPDTPIAHALRRMATTAEGDIHNRYNTRKEPPSGGRYTASNAVWHLPREELGDAPRPGDAILDQAGRRWTILEVQRATLGTRWQCAARDLAVVCALGDRITILAAEYHKASGGAAEPVWTVWKTDVRARIQPTEVDTGAELGAQRTVRRFQIFLEENLDLDHRHRIRGPDGTLYRVRGTLGSERIGELQSVDAEVVQ